MVAGAHQVGEGQNLGGVTGGDGHRAGTTLDGGHAGGHGIGGGVGQAAVDVARLGERELGGGVGRGVKLEGGRRVDGKRRGTGRGIGLQTGMDLQGVEVLGGVLGEVGVQLESHFVLLLRGYLSVDAPHGKPGPEPRKRQWRTLLSDTTFSQVDMVFNNHIRRYLPQR